MTKVALLVAMIAPLAISGAQTSAPRSRAAGLFVGGGFEGTSIVVFGDPNVEESGGGVDLTLGYGFSPHWSLYTAINAAQMHATGGGDYSLAHFDFGTRIHFRAGPHTVVPFIQIALTGRTEMDDLSGAKTTSSGGAISLGTGLNAHFSPAVAFSTSIMWTLGSFDTFKVGERPLDGSAIVAGSTRVQLGLMWFPQRTENRQ